MLNLSNPGQEINENNPHSKLLKQKQQSVTLR